MPSPDRAASAGRPDFQTASAPCPFPTVSEDTVRESQAGRFRRGVRRTHEHLTVHSGARTGRDRPPPPRECRSPALASSGTRTCLITKVRPCIFAVRPGPHGSPHAIRHGRRPSASGIGGWGQGFRFADWVRPESGSPRTDPAPPPRRRSHRDETWPNGSMTVRNGTVPDPA